ncbi:MAG: hypothetical protein QF426_04510 [Verrucomicrobiales bacterium]|jgi:hypothetical protein|nr:hypothetical protein [Verrucomicrobiales bacterium]
MAESRQSGHRNNRNRNRNRNSGSNPRRNRRYVKQKVPRKPKKKSLFQRLLNLFGLGGKKTKNNKKQRPQNRNNSKKRATPNRKQARQSRPPEKIPVTSERLYVGNISYQTSDENLIELFEKFGDVRSAEVVRHSRNARSKGYAFVEMNNLDAATKAAQELHDHEYMGRKIIVNGAKSRGKASD